MSEARALRLLEARVPFGAAELVLDVTTPSTANTTFAVKHQLPPGRYREVRVLPIRKDQTVDLYTAPDKPPEPGVLYLRATVASATVDLLLFLPRDADA